MAKIILQYLRIGLWAQPVRTDITNNQELSNTNIDYTNMVELQKIHKMELKDVVPYNTFELHVIFT